ncbi:MAG: serine protein kinase RIO [Candidatus Thermoplasmatota archaeon]|jgi:RIO kinase 1|nr:serine protein kinase RIO [Candidatus Thermoplasmatota archaeon]MCL5794146.1 serine protein kinase RIO [Candidatus Thermoplasmatota archaeon]
MKDENEKELSALASLLAQDEFRTNQELGRKTQSLVFDSRTLTAIYEVLKKTGISHIDYPISSGKESVVFKAFREGKPLVIKIFKMSTLKFQNIRQYIEGDYRFARERLERSRFIYLWAKKEFSNLEALRDAGIPSPKPILFHKNVILMSYIGTARSPAPQLREAEFNPEDVYAQVRTMMRAMYKKAEIVHADLSEYNILYHRKKAYIIDLAQGVSIKHPMADVFLRRDIKNITGYFMRKGIRADEVKLYKFVTGK